MNQIFKKTGRREGVPNCCLQCVLALVMCLLGCFHGKETPPRITKHQIFQGIILGSIPDSISYLPTIKDSLVEAARKAALDKPDTQNIEIPNYGSW